MEYPDISLDRFDRNNLFSSAFFLSHCHADHMVGLEAQEFADRLGQYPFMKLYCNPVTAGLLLAIPRFAHLGDYIQAMPSDEQQLVPVYSAKFELKYTLTVTLIPAGHCPGSVMFLIIGDAGTVLYTGDFRYHVGDTKRLRSLFAPSGDRLYSIRSVYVDTTFCTSAAIHIPSRQDCLKIITETVENWLKRNAGRSSQQIVHVFSRSSYGYEYLMIALAKHFRCRIHVNEQQFNKCRSVPSIANHLTTNASATQIHFCQQKAISSIDEDLSLCKRAKLFNKSELPCRNELSVLPNVLQIIPSVMYFTKGNVTPGDMLVSETDTVLRVCYSSHSSYEEIVDFLRELCPEFIYPNVRPNASLTLEEVREKLSFLEAGNVEKHSSAITATGGKFCFKRGRRNTYMSENHSSDGQVTSTNN